MNSAIEMQAQIETKMIPFGGKLSRSRAMTENGYSENSDERFADFMGNQVFARILRKIQNLQKRRNMFLASNAFLCEAPERLNTSTEKAQAQKKFSLEPHSTHKQRRVEVLIDPIQDALDCRMDRPLKRCSL